MYRVYTLTNIKEYPHKDNIVIDNIVDLEGLINEVDALGYFNGLHQIIIMPLIVIDMSCYNRFYNRYKDTSSWSGDKLMLYNIVLSDILKYKRTNVINSINV